MVDENIAKEYVKERLKDQWLVLGGDPSFICYMEQEVYPPGTPENRNFEIAVLPSHRMVLAKKTESLKAFLRDPPYFFDYINIIFSNIGKYKIAVQVCSIKHDVDFAKGIDMFVEDLFSQAQNQKEYAKKLLNLRKNWVLIGLTAVILLIINLVNLYYKSDIVVYAIQLGLFAIAAYYYLKLNRLKKSIS